MCQASARLILLQAKLPSKRDKQLDPHILEKPPSAICPPHFAIFMQQGFT